MKVGWKRIIESCDFGKGNPLYVIKWKILFQKFLPRDIKIRSILCVRDSVTSFEVSGYVGVWTEGKQVGVGVGVERAIWHIPYVDRI
jgi:hypothetical protein